MRVASDTSDPYPSPRLASPHGGSPWRIRHRARSPGLGTPGVRRPWGRWETSKGRGERPHRLSYDFTSATTPPAQSSEVPAWRRWSPPSSRPDPRSSLGKRTGKTSHPSSHDKPGPRWVFAGAGRPSVRQTRLRFHRRWCHVTDLERGLHDERDRGQKLLIIVDRHPSPKRGRQFPGRARRPKLHLRQDEVCALLERRVFVIPKDEPARTLERETPDVLQLVSLLRVVHGGTGARSRREVHGRAPVSPVYLTHH
jgi:hypothetical protein